jgi:hypothetical protein
MEVRSGLADRLQVRQLGLIHWKHFAFQLRIYGRQRLQVFLR